MKIFNCKRGTMFYGKDPEYTPGEDPDSNYLDSKIDLFLKQRLFRELVGIHQQITGLKDFHLLEAHGVKKYKQNWRYADGGRRNLIQGWIDKNDGRASTLLLTCCNSNRLEISSERSIIIHQKEARSNMILDRHVGGFRLYYPGRGYLDRSYQLRKTIDELKS